MPKRRVKKAAACCRCPHIDYIEMMLLKKHSPKEILYKMDSKYPDHRLSVSNIIYHRDKHLKPRVIEEIDPLIMDCAIKKLTDIESDYINPIAIISSNLRSIHEHAMRLDEDAKKYGYADPAHLKYHKAAIEGAVRFINAQQQLAQQSMVQNTNVEQRILAFVENKFESNQDQSAEAVTESLAVQVKKEQLAKRNTSLHKVFEKLENPPEEVLFGNQANMRSETIMVEDESNFDTFYGEEIKEEQK